MKENRKEKKIIFFFDYAPKKETRIRIILQKRVKYRKKTRECTNRNVGCVNNKNKKVSNCSKNSLNISADIRQISPRHGFLYANSDLEEIKANLASFQILFKNEETNKCNSTSNSCLSLGKCPRIPSINLKAVQRKL